ncbi:corepressor complex CRC230 [Toxoplasma gondii FOU]|uniref:Corepressor complex CRC230 n=1 Tax=Toxoplasma gondii FOU TaxID=943167 RepID=A0A086KLH9_TOXGO|nr:corepressor complex CRC230 [Toxoplasma gondii FOU]
MLWALCGQQRWAFGAIAQLVENSLSPVVASRNVFVSWEESPEKEPMLCIQDDGQGVDYPAMNALLRLFGTFEPGDRMRSETKHDSTSISLDKHMCVFAATEAMLHKRLCMFINV